MPVSRTTLMVISMTYLCFHQLGIAGALPLDSPNGGISHDADAHHRFCTTVRRRRPRSRVRFARAAVGAGYYPKQEFVHVDARDMDVHWVDTSAHGESAHAKYFGRLPTDELPASAPVLAYDRARLPAATTATTQVAALDLKTRNPQLA